MNASEKAQVASIEIAEMIALQTKSHTLTESIILPACRKMVKTMLRDEAEQEISKIPLSNNTIQRRIMDLSADIEENVQNKLQNSEFALQVDESTGINNKAQFLTFIRFIGGNQIINQFFCCEEMPLTTRSQDIFDILSAYLKKWNLSWNSRVGICTDGAPSMICSIKGFVSLIQQRNPNVILELKQVVEMVNYIKSRPLKGCLFEQICIDMVLRLIHELQKNCLHFFKEVKHERLLEYLQFSKLEYLTEIFAQLNSVNTIMQSRNENILTSTDKLVSFGKIELVVKRERLRCVEEELRVCLSQISPNIENLSKKHQAHVFY
uniref:Uncharacterized protein n=1 Tax=Octopus bimaculoides TaxID=37653 RepID=A0A0L8G4L0_OCTBM